MLTSACHRPPGTHLQLNSLGLLLHSEQKLILLGFMRVAEGVKKKIQDLGFCLVILGRFQKIMVCPGWDAANKWGNSMIGYFLFIYFFIFY